MTRHEAYDDRLRIWEVDCLLLDSILALSFEPEELLTRCQSAGVPLRLCDCASARQVLHAVHEASHADTPLARLVEHNLDVLHRASLERLEGGLLEELHDELRGADLWSVADLAGKLWALATSSGEGLDPLRHHVRGAIVVDGLRLLAERVHGPKATAEVLEWRL